jgi:hypothetical protein
MDSWLLRGPRNWGQLSAIAWWRQHPQIRGRIHNLVRIRINLSSLFFITISDCGDNLAKFAKVSNQKKQSFGHILLFPVTKNHYTPEKIGTNERMTVQSAKSERRLK